MKYVPLWLFNNKPLAKVNMLSKLLCILYITKLMQYLKEQVHFCKLQTIVMPQDKVDGLNL
jgi:hypothetical protein